MTGSAAADTIAITEVGGEIRISGLAAHLQVLGADADGRDRLQIDGGQGDDLIDAPA